ncbi:MAG TPA: hypothetical protein V6C88_02955, partial [Chroococcidiopsis sp.]
MDIQAALDLADELVFHKTGERLTDLQREILRASWSWEHQSYDQIAATYGYSANYLKKHVGPSLWKLLSDILQEKVSKTNARAAFERRLQNQAPPRSLDVDDTAASALPFRRSVALIPPPSADIPADILAAATSTDIPVDSSATIPADLPVATLQVDWGEAIALDTFCGRQTELRLLEQWIRGEQLPEPPEPTGQRCRLVGVFGAGGIGKTSLSARLAQQLVEGRQSAFEFVIWRSLRNAPLLSDLLTDVIQVLS